MLYRMYTTDYSRHMFIVLLHSHPQYDSELVEAVLGDLQPFSSFSVSIGLKLYEVMRI